MESQQFDDLEIRIFSGYTGGYSAELHMPDGGRASATLAPPPLGNLQAANEPQQYGRLLFQWLFHGELAEAFAYARGFALEPMRAVSSPHIRLRLWLDPQAPALADLSWECLCDPAHGDVLSISMLFSRFVRARTPRSEPTWERPLRVLLIATTHAGPDMYSFETILQEIESASGEASGKTLGPLLHLDRLQGPATFANITRTLHVARAEQREYHIIHFMAHAQVAGSAEHVLLENGAGGLLPVPAGQLEALLSLSGSRPPMLLFLAMPLLGKQQPGQLTSLASKIIETGVETVISVHTPIVEPDLRLFTTQFYRQLIESSAIDIAVARARATLFSPATWAWSEPRLYTRSLNLQLSQRISATESLWAQKLRATE